MAKEKEIVDYINTTMRAGQLASKRFQKGNFYSIAELVKKNAEGETMPSIIPQDGGNVTEISPSDIPPIIVYHRLLDISTEYDTENDFGDPDAIKQTASMICVVMADRYQIQLTKEELIAGVGLGFPLEEVPASLLTSTGLQDAAILPGNFNLDRDAVYQQEFNIATMELPINYILFSYEYSIQTEVLRSCFELC